MSPPKISECSRAISLASKRTGTMSISCKIGAFLQYRGPRDCHVARLRPAIAAARFGSVKQSSGGVNGMPVSVASARHPRRDRDPAMHRGERHEQAYEPADAAAVVKDVE